MPQERLQKLIAQAGLASRRGAEKLIEQGRVTVNGEKITVGAKADPATDEIRVDGERLKSKDLHLVYIMLNKPAGIVSTVQAQEQEKRQTVLDLVHVPERVYPVGRLDADSEGLILLTNDGDLTAKLTHPRYGHRKIYRVLVKGFPSSSKVAQWAAGVELDDGKTAPCIVRVHRKLEHATWLEVVMSEGRKRQIRRTAAALHLYVEQLIRIGIGPLKLTGLKPGEWRTLTGEEVAELKRTVKTRRVRKPGSGRRPGNRRTGTGTRSGGAGRSSNPKGGARGTRKSGAKPKRKPSGKPPSKERGSDRQ